MKDVMIVAGEASGDMHGAALVAAMKEIDPTLHFFGVGDQALAEQGVDILYRSRQIAVVGIVEVLTHWRPIRDALAGLSRRLVEKTPRLLILIDFPDFNLILARRAKKLGIPVFYYISPQVWAWRSGRVKTIARLVDRLAVILPFEEEFYHSRGVEHVTFVGHPLVDSVRSEMHPGQFRKQVGLDAEGTVIGILPGSRKREITSILPDFVKTARLLKGQDATLSFLLPLAPTLTEKDLGLSEKERQELSITVVTGYRYELMAACDVVMAASGTVTLELALLGVPMVVTYRIAPLTYFLGRRLVSVQFASLVNLVAGREVVQELIQTDFTPEKLAQALRVLWPGTERQAKMVRDLREVGARLGRPGASRNAARLALALIA
ncbi:MAG: lipid-A-disaccharide synthase [Proteobacteria bacterium]|nr:lipid-A-disaccharide synthase [Pseudomonadota bacterium]